MQKQKIDHSVYYLVLSSDYETVQCGLYKAGNRIAVCQENKMSVSKNLMLILTTMLSEEALSWSDLSYIGVNQGPSPFTTLRVVITTVNGLLFSLGKPVIGIDGIKTFLEEQYTSEVLVALLHAFNHDLYFGIATAPGIYETGWEFSGTLLLSLQKRFGAQPITFIGNGVKMYQEQILNFFPHAVFQDPLPETVSLDAIAAKTYELYQSGMVQHEPLLPLYLKTLEYKQST